MKQDVKRLEKIFKKTDGVCHLCRQQLNFKDYGTTDKSGSWEIEHLVPKSKGGTDHLNNLSAAHPSCNRSKGGASTKSARAQHGFRRAPNSKSQKTSNAWVGAFVGSLSVIFVPPPLRLVALVVGAAAGAIVGYDGEPE